jgi:uncharacterized protein
VTIPGLPELIALAALGVAAGFLAGLLGVGGGILMVPGMVLLIGADQHVAQGTSLVVIIPAAISGTLAHYRARRFRPRDAVALAAGGIAGAVIGSVTALNLDAEVLRRIFAAFLLLSAIRLAWPIVRRPSSLDAPADDPEEPGDRRD